MRGLASQLPHGPAAATSVACPCCRRHCTACAAMLQRVGMVWATERGQQEAGTNEQGNRQHRGRLAMGELHAKLDEREGCRGRQAAAQRSATDSLRGQGACSSVLHCSSDLPPAPAATRQRSTQPLSPPAAVARPAAVAAAWRGLAPPRFARPTAPPLPLPLPLSRVPALCTLRPPPLVQPRVAARAAVDFIGAAPAAALVGPARSFH